MTRKLLTCMSKETVLMEHMNDIQKWILRNIVFLRTGYFLRLLADDGVSWTEEVGEQSCHRADDPVNAACEGVGVCLDDLVG